MDEIIVIRAADPDGSIFKAIVNALKGKRAEVVHINAPASSVLRIGELEIHHEHRRCAGGQQGSAAQPWRLCSAYLHGQFTRASVLKGTTLCSGLGRGVSAWDHIGGEYYLAFEEEVGGLLVFGIHKNDGGSRL